MLADARKVKQIVYNLLSNAVKFSVDGGQVTLRAGRVPRAEVGQLSGTRAGRSFPAGRERVRGVPRDQRDRQRHRHLAGGPGAAVQALQPDRQRPVAQVRRHGAGPGHGQAARRAARRRGGGGERRGRGLLLHGLAAVPGVGGGADAGRAPDGAPRRRSPGARTALVVEDDLKAADLLRVQLEAEGFKVRARRLRRGRAGARDAAAVRRSSPWTSCCPTWTAGSFSAA